jgi:hypothetical protein
MIGARGDPLGTGLEDLHGAGVRVVALALVYDRAHAIARNPTGDKHDIAAVAQPRDALSAKGERVDPQLQLIPSLWAGGDLQALGAIHRHSRRLQAHAGASSSSSSAFCA